MHKFNEKIDYPRVSLPLFLQHYLSSIYLPESSFQEKQRETPPNVYKWDFRKNKTILNA